MALFGQKSTKVFAQEKRRMKYKHRISVFTPTYNRGYIIGKLYLSLQKQTFRDFEWIVVDDGSIDNTEELFRSWCKEGKISIRYYKTQNGGKHRAINRGLDEAEGEIFFTVDSDDQLTVDALSKIDIWFSEIEGIENIVGVVANKGYTETKTVNAHFAEKYIDAKLSDMPKYEENQKKVLSGEKAIAFYTDFHRRYKFPQFPGENFMTEAVVYNRMAHDGYKMRFFNDIIYLFEYHEDGLTRAGTSNFIRNPKGYGLWVRERMMYDNQRLLERIKTYYCFTCDLMNDCTEHEISDAIGVPSLEVHVLKVIHNLKTKIKVLGRWRGNEETKEFKD